MRLLGIIIFLNIGLNLNETFRYNSLEYKKTSVSGLTNLDGRTSVRPSARPPIHYSSGHSL